MTPNVNAEWLNIFLAGMSDHGENKNIILIMDCAGWHKAKDLVVPDNIQIVYLPPYSPELNPSERLWQYIKSETIKNKIYETIERLEDAVCSCVKNLNAALIKSICSMDYLLN